MVEVLHAEIRAEATGGETIAKVKAETAELRAEINKLHGEERHSTALFGRFAEAMAFAGERSEGLREHAVGLREALGENGETLGELLPMLGAFGAAASITGLVDLARETAEARTQLNAMATTLGLTTEQLQAYQLGAKEADVPVEEMQSGILRLDRAVTAAASGKSKDVAQIFARMGISLRDANGHLKSADQILPLVGESLRRTTDSTLRNAVAMQLFGRSGAYLIPFLVQGKDKIDELQKASARLNASYTDEDNENVERFKNSWIELDTAVGGLKDTITADLAPILTPAVEEFTDWTAANREWIGQDIAGDVKRLGGALEEIPWREVKDDGQAVAHVLNEGANAVGGWVRIGEVMVGLAVLKFTWGLAQPLAEMAAIGVSATKLGFTLTHELAEAWGIVGKEAEKAAASEEAAAHGGVAEAAAATGGEHGGPRRTGGIRAAARMAGAIPLAATAYELVTDGPPLLNYLAHLDGSPEHTTGGGRGYTGPTADPTHAVDTPTGRNAGRGTVGHGEDLFGDAGSDIADAFRWLRGLHDRSYAGADGTSGEVKVSVQLQNAPPGTTATVEQSGNVRADPPEVGHSQPMGYPTR